MNMDKETAGRILDAALNTEQPVRRMFRYTVPIDDDPHVIELSHSPVGVAARATLSMVKPVVEFWCENTEGPYQSKRTFQVFGTGHQLPEDARWIATCPRDSFGLVWHLYEIGHGTP